MSNEFRPLNNNERAMIAKAAKVGRGGMPGILFNNIDSLEVSYEFMQGGFCVCLLALNQPLDVIIFRGASRRSYKDRRNQVRGEMLAFSRAVLYSRPVEIW